jgi:hypothetical protein
MLYFAILLAFKFALALLTLLAALRAAWLWWAASAKMPRLVDFVAGSPDHVLQVESEAAEAAVLNSKAALRSGAIAVLAALNSDLCRNGAHNLALICRCCCDGSELA